MTSKAATVTAKAVSPIGLIASILVWASTNIHAQGHTPAQILAAIFAAATAAAHSGTVKKIVKKVPKPVRRRKKSPWKYPPMLKVFDSVSVNALRGIVSSSQEGVMGYVNGMFDNMAAVEKAFPGHFHSSIAVNDTVGANWLDIERGDATVDQAPGWYTRFRKHGARGFYISLSNLPALRQKMRAAGFSDGSYEVWVADWVGFLFIPDVGAAGCQCINDTAKDYDESLVHTKAFFGLRN